MLTRHLAMTLEWNNCKGEFARDGALRDIQVVDATAADWQRVLDFVRSGAGKLEYSVDGISAAMPSDAATIN